MDLSNRQWALIGVIVLAICIWGWRHGPYATPLPWDVADLSEIQPQLAKLNEEERQLVLDYLKRSNGDVLPAAMADPDEPLTARTFGEAIELQREWRKQEAVHMDEAKQRRAARDALLQPLREALSADMVKRELLTHEQLYGPPSAQSGKDGRAVVRALDERVTLVVTYRLWNTSRQGITAATGSISIRNAADEELTGCWIDHREVLAAGASVDIRCGKPNEEAGAAARDFLTLPASQYSLIWEPRSITFDDGRVLTAPD